MVQQHPPRSHAIHSRIRSFSRAGGRLTERQQAALERLSPRYVLDIPRDDGVRTVSPDTRLDVGSVFGHGDAGDEPARPLIIEVGPGSGEAIIAQAAAHPERDYLAVEVWQTAIARIVSAADRAGLENLRVAPVDASQLFERALPEGCATEVWTFFPDPWRKPRHRKRRLVSESFARSVARVLQPGGRWRLATDWADYAWQMRDVLEAMSTPGDALTGTAVQADVESSPAALAAPAQHAAATPSAAAAPLPAQPLFTFPDAGARPDLGRDQWIEGDLGCGPDPGSPAGVVGGWSERFAGRVMTRFEQRGIEAGRVIRDLTAVRTSAVGTTAAAAATLPSAGEGGTPPSAACAEAGSTLPPAL